MNVELLESVRQAVVHYPERFCAAQWAFARNAAAVRSDGASPQNFRCCIAGHVLLQHGSHTEAALLEEGGFHTGGALWEQAASALDLDRDGCRELFFPSQWDKPYKQNYYLCSRDEEAEVAAAYLDYFMQKHGGATDAPEEARPAPSVEQMPVRQPSAAVSA